VRSQRSNISPYRLSAALADVRRQRKRGERRGEGWERTARARRRKSERGEREGKEEERGRDEHRGRRHWRREENPLSNDYRRRIPACSRAEKRTILSSPTGRSPPYSRAWHRARSNVGPACGRNRRNERNPRATGDPKRPLRTCREWALRSTRNCCRPRRCNCQRLVVVAAVVPWSWLRRGRQPPPNCRRSAASFAGSSLRRGKEDAAAREKEERRNC